MLGVGLTICILFWWVQAPVHRTDPRSQISTYFHSCRGAHSDVCPLRIISAALSPPAPGPAQPAGLLLLPHAPPWYVKNPGFSGWYRQLCSMWPGLVCLMFMVLGMGYAYACAVTHIPGLGLLPRLRLLRNSVLTGVTLLPITHLHSLPRCLLLCPPLRASWKEPCFSISSTWHPCPLWVLNNCLFKEWKVLLRSYWSSWVSRTETGIEADVPS